jgi:hypothetical protein
MAANVLTALQAAADAARARVAEIETERDGLLDRIKLLDAEQRGLALALGVPEAHRDGTVISRVIQAVGVGETVRFSEICRRAGEPRQDIVGVALRRAVSKGWFEKLGTGLYRRLSQPAPRANHKTPSQEGDEVR